MFYDLLYPINTQLMTLQCLQPPQNFQNFRDIIKAIWLTFVQKQFAFAHIILSAVHSVYLFHIVFSVCFPCRHCSPSANLQTGPLASFLSLCISTICRLSICLLLVWQEADHHSRLSTCLMVFSNHFNRARVGSFMTP
jgi:hypothetical protein